ncbi:hypothetical protein TNCV_563901 [Trichonephila clavipes]|nr:hypothetical protein TNCV_563901 [Trichonephila clavipes]
MASGKTVSFFFNTKSQPESVAEPNEFSNIVIPRDPGVPSPHPRDLTAGFPQSGANKEMHIEMHEQKQDIEELESLDPIQSEDRITVRNLIEGRS